MYLSLLQMQPCQMHPALMERLDFEMDTLRVKDEWKSVSTMHGELCVIMDGTIVMPQLYAENWDTIQQVHIL